MPESAEVTVAARRLDLVTRERVLGSLDVTHPRTTRAQPAASFAAFTGAVVESVRSHGKWIVVTFHGVEERLGIHLRMSGQLLAHRPGAVPSDRHVHAVLRFGPRADVVATPRNRQARICAGSAPTVPAPPAGAAGADSGAVDVWFRDPRTFGELRVLSGAVPVAPDLHDPAVLASALAADAARRRIGAKAVLLDQTRTVSGIGSYLADETLHGAGIAPTAPAYELRPSAWERILAASRRIATASAAAGGVTLPDEGWLDLWGRPGRYGPELRVHGRPTCATCAEPTRSAVVGGRSARWCPRCQPVRRRR